MSVRDASVTGNDFRRLLTLLKALLKVLNIHVPDMASMRALFIVLDEKLGMLEQFFYKGPTPCCGLLRSFIRILTKVNKIIFGAGRKSLFSFTDGYIFSKNTYFGASSVPVPALGEKIGHGQHLQFSACSEQARNSLASWNMFLRHGKRNCTVPSPPNSHVHVASCPKAIHSTSRNISNDAILATGYHFAF